MTIRTFKEARYAAYTYDTEKDVVMSTKLGSLRPLTWSKAKPWSEPRVTLSYSGYGVSYSKSDIMKMLNPEVVGGRTFAEAVAKSVPLRGTVNVRGLSPDGPDFPYVMYSVKNQASQYFFAKTSFDAALGMFAARGEHLEVSEVRVLNVLTQKVFKLQAKTQYALASV